MIRGAGVIWKDPAMTDFRARGTIMGLAGLTAVFGMGTGGTPPVSSPEFDRRSVSLSGRGGSGVVTQAGKLVRSVVEATSSVTGHPTDWGRLMDLMNSPFDCGRDRVIGGGGSGWSSGWLLGPVGCDGRPSCTPGLSTWSSSRSLRK